MTHRSLTRDGLLCQRFGFAVAFGMGLSACSSEVPARAGRDDAAVASPRAMPEAQRHVADSGAGAPGALGVGNQGGPAIGQAGSASKGAAPAGAGGTGGRNSAANGGELATDASVPTEDTMQAMASLGAGAGSSVEAALVNTEHDAGIAPSEPLIVVSDGTGTGTLGAACRLPSDCEAGLFCLLADDAVFGGEVPAGLCTMQCEFSEECQSLDEYAECVSNTVTFSDGTTGYRGYCLEGCTIQLQDEKCHQRLNVGCFSIERSGVFGACLPRCHNDSVCSDGRACDPATGFCVERQLTGLLDGQVCRQDAECLGRRCALVTDDVGVCSSNCVLHADGLACQHAAGSDKPIASVCLPSENTFNYNDLSTCLPACDVDSDCLAPQACVLLDEEFVTTFDRQGLCGPW